MSLSSSPVAWETCGNCMSREVVTVDPNSSLLEAARLMRELQIGVLPVCQGTASLPRLLGVVTDRDIVVRVIAEDLHLESIKVGEVMSSPVIYCFSDESPWTALHLMEQHLIRRLPVVDRVNRRIVGMLSVSDLSRFQPERIPESPKWTEQVLRVMSSQRSGVEQF